MRPFPPASKGLLWSIPVSMIPTAYKVTCMASCCPLFPFFHRQFSVCIFRNSISITLENNPEFIR